MKELNTTVDIRRMWREGFTERRHSPSENVLMLLDDIDTLLAQIKELQDELTESRRLQGWIIRDEIDSSDLQI